MKADILLVFHSIFFVWRVYCADMFFNISIVVKGISVHYDRFLTLLFSVEVLSTYEARIYIKKSAGNAP